MATTLLRASPSLLLPLSTPSSSSSASSARILSRKPHLCIIRSSAHINPPSPIAISISRPVNASSPASQILKKPSLVISGTRTSWVQTLIALSKTLTNSLIPNLISSLQNLHRQVSREDLPSSPSSEMEQINDLKKDLCMASTTGMAPSVLLCFAAISTNSVNTPLTVVASGMAKWLELYSGVLMVRVLLSWFPNIPWERQPLQAIRDMCDPYLNLFRNIVPPLFNALDVSPLLAFLVLGLLASILNTTIQA